MKFSIKIILVFILATSMGILNISDTKVNSLEWSNNYSMRTSTYEIDDSGRFNNPKDVYDFSTITGKSVSEWMTLGYTTVSIKLHFEMREINAGYQYVFVYRNSFDTSDDNYLFETETIEYGGGGLADKDWGSYLFELDNISLSDLDENGFTIRYGASGFGNDDWENKDMTVSIVLT
ncbi:MAG: hypothetical protein K9L26_04580 [Candidatus Izimaplasma sp.]|nr:hypothetical protein [Candidatus Izimaplasma bacterium]